MSKCGCNRDCLCGQLVRENNATSKRNTTPRALKNGNELKQHPITQKLQLLPNNNHLQQDSDACTCMRKQKPLHTERHVNECIDQELHTQATQQSPICIMIRVPRLTETVYRERRSNR